MKYGNLFDAIPENFFTMLTGHNKRFYADCLIELHETSIFTDAADFDRDVVNRIILACMDDYQGTLEEENAGDVAKEGDVVQAEPGVSSLPTKESAFRRLVICGWIEADFDDNRRQLISFTLPALTIIPQLKRMASPSRISLGGYTRNIIDNLQAVLTAKHPYQDAFLLAVNNTYQFMQEMAKIRVAIRNEVESIFQCNSFLDMTEMLNTYLDSYLNGDYFKLQFEENLTAVERRKITNLLMDIENNEPVFQALIDGAKDHLTLDSDEDASLHILKAIETIRSRLCDEYERQYREIQKNQARYVTNATSRMSMLITDKRDVDSTINRIIRAMTECSEEDFEDRNTQITWLQMLKSVMTMPQAVQLNEGSFYKAKTPARNRNTDIEPLSIREKKSLEMSDLKGCLPKYSAVSVNRMLHRYMEGKDCLFVDELPLSSREDFNSLVSMVLFSGEQECDYTVEMATDRIDRNGYTSPGFIVKRKDTSK